jgi:hypothetical protein
MNICHRNAFILATSLVPFSDAEREDLLAFLKTLTDDAFIAAPSL